jgi:hypothetical protein
VVVNAWTKFVVEVKNNITGTNDMNIAPLLYVVMIVGFDFSTDMIVRSVLLEISDKYNMRRG